MFDYFNKAVDSGPLNKIFTFVKQLKITKSYTIAGLQVGQGEKISEGGYGYVYIGHDKDDFDKKYALKKIMVQDSINQEAVNREVGLWSQLADSPNICKFLGHTEEQVEDSKEVVIL